MAKTYLLLEEIHNMRGIYLKAINKQHKIWKAYFWKCVKLDQYLADNPNDLEKRAEKNKYRDLKNTAYEIKQKLTEEREELYNFARNKKNKDLKRMEYLMWRCENLVDWVQEDWRLEVE